MTNGWSSSSASFDPSAPTESTNRKNTSMPPSLPLAYLCFAIAAVAFPAGLHALWINWREERRVRERLKG